uniref:F-box domain-containing protein n=1 Tax=Daucus carota subsp. sativus TaxID=79200 RepID=A0A161XR75_DAUCS
MQRVRVSSQQAPVHKLGDSQMTLSPKFRLAALRSSLFDSSVEAELELRGEPLIPGLPDDIAHNCLLRLPVESHTSCKSVSRRWYQLLGISEHERIKLKVYYTNTDCWEAVAGAPLPEQICKPFSVNCCESRIYVVGRNLHVAVGHISRTKQAITPENQWNFSVQWQVVDAPAAFSNLVPTSAQVLFA